MSSFHFHQICEYKVLFVKIYVCQKKKHLFSFLQTVNIYYQYTYDDDFARIKHELALPLFKL
jgi:hypothetical protein